MFGCSASECDSCSDAEDTQADARTDVNGRTDQGDIIAEPPHSRAILEKVVNPPRTPTARNRR